MKKIFSIIIVCSFLLSLTACGGTNQAKNEQHHVPNITKFIRNKIITQDVILYYSFICSFCISDAYAI